MKNIWRERERYQKCLCLFVTEKFTGQSQSAFTLPLVPALGEETDDSVDTSSPITQKSGKF